MRLLWSWLRQQELWGRLSQDCPEMEAWRLKKKQERGGDGGRERVKGKEGEKISNCSDFSKVQSPSQMCHPRLIHRHPSSWHCGPGPSSGFEFGFVYFFRFGNHFGFLDYLLLVSDLAPLLTLVCTFNKVLAPPSVTPEGWPQRPALPIPSWGLSLRSKHQPSSSPAHPCLSFFQILFCGNRAGVVLVKYLQ